MKHYYVTAGRKSFVVDADGYIQAAIEACNVIRRDHPAEHAVRLSGKPGLRGTFQAMCYNEYQPRPVGPKFQVAEV